MEFQQNGFDYQVLEAAAKRIKGVDGIICEIGLRAAGGTKLIMDTLISNHDTDRLCVAIDPYGELPYQVTDTQTTGNDYTNIMMKKSLASIYTYIQNFNLDFYFFPLEDFEFFKRYSEGIPYYGGKEKKFVNNYALVYFDGPHTTQITLDETKFFEPRAVHGSCFVYDDITGYYDHQVITDYLLERNWTLGERTQHKVFYIKE
jgi:hypothetical protein